MADGQFAGVKGIFESQQRITCPQCRAEGKTLFKARPAQPQSKLNLPKVNLNQVPEPVRPRFGKQHLVGKNEDTWVHREDANLCERHLTAAKAKRAARRKEEEEEKIRQQEQERAYLGCLYQKKREADMRNAEMLQARDGTKKMGFDHLGKKPPNNLAQTLKPPKHKPLHKFGDSAINQKDTVIPNGDYTAIHPALRTNWTPSNLNEPSPVNKASIHNPNFSNRSTRFNSDLPYMPTRPSNYRSSSSVDTASIHSSDSTVRPSRTPSRYNPLAPMDLGRSRRC